MDESANVDPPRRSLTDWFTRVEPWSTSKKTRLFSGLAFLAHLVFICGSALPMGFVHGVDAKGYFLLTLVGAAVLGLVFLASVVEVALGHEGRWTAYALVIAYGTWITSFIQGLGSWGTVTWALYPLAVVVIALYFGGGIGWVSFAAGIALISAREVLERSGIIAYAPLLQDANASTQPSGAFVVATAATVFGTYVFCFAFSLLVVAARRHQAQRLELAHRRLERANELVARYAPRQVSAQILAGEHAPNFAPERRRLTLFFSDVVGFTQSSDEMDPESLADALNTYFETMTEIAERHGGTVDKFFGDGMMAFFGAPTAEGDQADARAAVAMALEMQRALPALNEMWLSHGGRRKLEVRMGIHTGYASVGDFGSATRKTYSAIGLQVNLASRVQDQCKPGAVLVTDATWTLIRQHFDGIEEGEFSLKGIHYPVRCYAVTGPRER